MTSFVRVFFTACSFSISTLMIMAQDTHATAGSKPAIYVCSPCGQDCDKKTYDKPGECAVCHMPLVKKSSITFKSINPSGIHAYLKSHPKTILLDVRTKEEFEGKANPNFGTLKNAINIPVQELDTRLAELGKYKKTEIIVYCSHAHRSAQASFILTQNGFHHVLNMSGGVSTMTDSSYRNIFR
jgi:rhodanese-related sulfurtransferase